MKRIRVKGEAFEGDRVIWILMTLLALASIVVVLSSTASMAYRRMGGDMFHFFTSQLLHLGAGFMIVWGVHKVDFQSFKNRAGSIFLFAVFLMFLTFVIGVSINGASRWLRVPIIGATFQPSDFLKIALVIFLAKQLARKQKIIDKIPILPSLKFSSWKKNKQKNMDILLKTSLPLLGPVVLSCLLIIVSNFSTSAMVFLCSMFMLIVGRVRYKEIFRMLGIAIVGCVLLITIMSVAGVGRAETWRNRILSYTGIEMSSDDKGENSDKRGDELQVEQAKIAIASGGLVGKGPGNSTQRTNLPHSYSDFAYAFIIEEYGFVGAFVILILYLCVLYRAMTICQRSDDTFSSLVVWGLGLTIVIQAMVNMSVSSTLTPVTGQTLPIISLGGSSLLFTCMSFGIILSISRQAEQERKKAMEIPAEQPIE